MYYSGNLSLDKKNKQQLFTQQDTCDKYDYLSAIACGAIGGIVDIFFVGMPGDSLLGKWTDSQVNNCVMLFAKKLGWSPKSTNETNLSNAIASIERRFEVNYDQKYSADVDGLFDMTMKNHHMMSLAHSPDIVGLFFSVLNQFTNTSTFISNGEFITISTDTFYLQGNNFVSKLFCGVINWFGHLMSDFAGSSISSKRGNRGTGINIPFYELLG